MNKKVEIIKKFATGDYGQDDKSPGLTDQEVYSIVEKEGESENFLKSV
jgi:hypothetical protein